MEHGKDQSSQLTQHTIIDVCALACLLVSVPVHVVCRCICGKCRFERYALPWFFTQTFILLTVCKIALLVCCSTYSCVRVYSIICFIHFVFAFFFFVVVFLAHFVFDKAEIFSKNEHCCWTHVHLYMRIVQYCTRCTLRNKTMQPK